METTNIIILYFSQMLFYRIPLHKIYIYLGIQYNRVLTSLTIQRLLYVCVYITYIYLTCSLKDSSSARRRRIFQQTYVQYIYRTIEIIYIFLFLA